jgi:hypothetical protein
MFDNSEYRNNQAVNIKPACIGMMQKSHPKSYFEWCHLNSSFRENKVDGNPRILQIMVFGDNNMLVEILPEEVYNEWVKEEEKKTETK